LRRLAEPKHTVEVAIVGKYVEHQDAYKSLCEALTHAGAQAEVRVAVRRVDAGAIEAHGPEKYLDGVDGVLVPGGFGSRGIEGKILAAQYARLRKIPYLGLCLGMQIAVIEFARNVLGLSEAHSTEFAPDTRHPVICLLDEQRRIVEKGGTMRLGSSLCILRAGTKAMAAYGRSEVMERHRHRYEVNNAYRERMEKAGFIVSGMAADAPLVEMMELLDHPWFVGCQFHPEFQSKPNRPHPLFLAFLRAALAHAEAARYPLLEGRG
jgi:CTP synthase